MGLRKEDTEPYWKIHWGSGDITRLRTSGAECIVLVFIIKLTIFFIGANTYLFIYFQICTASQEGPGKLGTLSIRLTSSYDSYHYVLVFYFLSSIYSYYT